MLASRLQEKFLLRRTCRAVILGGRIPHTRIMTLLQQAISLAFPFIDGTDPLILAPVLALVVSFALIGLFGAVLAAQEFFRSQVSK